MAGEPATRTPARLEATRVARGTVGPLQLESPRARYAGSPPAIPAARRSIPAQEQAEEARRAGLRGALGADPVKARAQVLATEFAPGL